MRYKLISKDGALLGSLDVPDDVSQRLKDRRYVEGAYMPSLRAVDVRLDREMPVMASIQKFVLEHDYDYRDGVRLHGNVSIEELEKLPGWHFSPSVAYLRSIIAEGQGE